jgi:hypothetical protein
MSITAVWYQILGRSVDILQRYSTPLTVVPEHGGGSFHSSVRPLEGYWPSQVTFDTSYVRVT